MDLRHCASALNGRECADCDRSADIKCRFHRVDLNVAQLRGHQEPPTNKTSHRPKYDVPTVISNHAGVATKRTEATESVNSKAFFKGEHCSTGFKVQDEDRAAH